MGVFISKDPELRKQYYEMPCAVCGHPYSDPAHIRTYGASGEDSQDNIMPLCRRHHTMQHQLGWLRFAQNFPSILDALGERGWRLDERGKLHRI